MPGDSGKVMKSNPSIRAMRVDALTLLDLGEREILNSIVFPSIARSRAGLSGIGDDCAILELPQGIEQPVLVATADPCPKPVIFELFDPDYWHYGWLTAVINLSDLASMGAQAAGLLVSTVMPDGMPAADYQRFWDGLVAASDTWGCKIVGGNIKDGPAFSADGMALGWCSRDKAMQRVGCQAGDLVYAIGESGTFWSAVLHHSKVPDLVLPADEQRMVERALTHPQARIREGLALARSGLVTSCMDASDGVLGCLMELGRRNGLDVHLDAEHWEPHPLVCRIADATGVDIAKIMLSWGDWQLVVTVPPGRKFALENLMHDLETRTTLLGRMSSGAGRVWLDSAMGWQELENLASERFSKRSYFTGGIRAYMDWFISAPLFAGENR